MTRPPTAMELRVAKALCNDPDDYWIAIARISIRAMYEPTEKMIADAGEDVHWNYNCNTCGGLTDGWHKLVNAASPVDEGE